MSDDLMIDDLLRRGTEFDFEHNSKWNENGQFCKPSVELLAWITEVQQFILERFGKKSEPGNLMSKFDYDDEFKYACSEDEFDRHINYLKAALTACRKLIPLKVDFKFNNPLDFINIVFKGFHNFAIQLQKRHNKRSTFEIRDEYDVQDLMSALLRIRFKDVRNEECAPSCAGSSSRIDFLLKNEQIAIKIKMTRKGLSDKEIGNQLVEDIKRYQSHPECKRLMCFIYDRDFLISNPNGLISDLSQSDGFAVDVFISPQR